MSTLERSYENCEIYCNWQGHGQNLRNLVIWLQERSLQSYKIAKITKFTWTAKFTLIRKSIDLVYEIYSELQESPLQSNENCKNYELYEIYENCEIYCNSQEHQQNLRNLFIGLKGRPLQSYENWIKLRILRNLREFVTPSKKSMKQRVTWNL